MLQNDIIVIVTKERNPTTNREELIASHGIDSVTGKVVILPTDRPQDIGAEYDADIGEYIIRATPSSAQVLKPAHPEKIERVLPAEAPKRRFFRR